MRQCDPAAILGGSDHVDRQQFDPWPQKEHCDRQHFNFTSIRALSLAGKIQYDRFPSMDLIEPSH